jgi:hypothetical protein
MCMVVVATVRALAVIQEVFSAIGVVSSLYNGMNGVTYPSSERKLIPTIRSSVAGGLTCIA